MIKRFIKHNGKNVFFVVFLSVVYALFSDNGLYDFYTGLFMGLFILLINGFMEAKDKTITKISEVKHKKRSRNREKFILVFNSSLNRLWGILVVVFLCGIFASWVFLESDNRQRTTAIFLLYLALMLYIIAEAIFQKLIFTETGIEQRTLFYKTHVSWDDVLEVARLNRGTYVVICKTAIRNFIRESELADQKLTLPFNDNNWKTHEIRKIIEANAPQLEFIESAW